MTDAATPLPRRPDCHPDGGDVIPMDYQTIVAHIRFAMSTEALVYDDPRTIHAYCGDGVPRTADGTPYIPLTWEGILKPCL